MRYLKRYKHINENSESDIEDILLDLADNGIKYHHYKNEPIKKIRIYPNEKDLEPIIDVVERIGTYLNKIPIFKTVINQKFQFLTSYREKLANNLIDKISHIDVLYYSNYEISLRKSLKEDDKIDIVGYKGITIIRRKEISIIFELDSYNFDLEEISIYSENIEKIHKYKS